MILPQTACKNVNSKDIKNQANSLELRTYDINVREERKTLECK